jgi:cellulose synthase/poly-beta-1,6-N-acetylglucosamine synthase-like glycosyltransferase
MILTIYALAMLVIWTGSSFYLLVNSRRLAYLKNIPPLKGDNLPPVAVVIAVKDEEAEVEEALRSVCNLNYTAYRIVVINDRSTDSTPTILQKMAAGNSRLTLLTVDSLPEGWLGKNHALYRGYLASSEEWILFTDADVRFERDTLRKAMQLAQQNSLDHLTVLPEVTSRSLLFKSVMYTFAVMLEMKLRPWDASKPSSKASMGIGAFNLLKRSAYELAGTHTVISLRPDDDLKLGERIKQAGLRQEVAYGMGEISLQWYTSLSQFVNGLMKNTFSVANYNLALAFAMALATLLILVLPLPLLLLSGYPYNLAGLIILVAQVLAMVFKRGPRATWWQALLVPFAGLVMVYIIIRSALLTVKQGGIYWRDSFYSLAELKKQS